MPTCVGDCRVPRRADHRNYRRSRECDCVSGEWVSRGVTAVAAFNDEVAALVLGATIRLGVSVPDTLAIVGHDDTPLAQLLVPSLSTVRVDISGLGKYFAAVALSAARKSPTPQISPQVQRAKLVVRESS
ncbi:substrate-binding domain-containing protein [Leifsonia kafniensis]|uniref:substrate-binding domain-containing protein n=1 Tax=Leifsonia kafniensis TaxID=475957 RepID=UPI003CD0B190